MRTLLLLLVLTSPCCGYTTMKMNSYDEWLHGGSLFPTQYNGVYDQQPDAVINTLAMDRTYSGFDFVDFHFNVPIWAFFFDQTGVGANGLITDVESWAPYYSNFGVTMHWPTSNITLIHEANHPELTAHLTSISWVCVVPEPSSLVLSIALFVAFLIRRQAHIEPGCRS